MSERAATTRGSWGETLPLRPDFPVKWEEPGDEDRLWTLAPTRYPEPMTPLEFEVLYGTYVHGFNYAAQRYSLPIRFDARCVNGYFYQTFTPTGGTGDLSESVAKLVNRIDCVGPCTIGYTQNAPEVTLAEHYPDLHEAVYQLRDYWDTELSPEIEKHLSDWEDFDLLAADTPQLLNHLEEIHKGIKRLGEIRFLANFALSLALYLFEDLYRELFGNEATLEAHRLWQGLDSKKQEMNRELWQLSRAALIPEVRKVLEESPAADVASRLEQTTEGEAFLVKFDEFLEKYGQQRNGYPTIGLLSWTEDPTSVFKGLKDYLYRYHDPAAVSAGLAAEREWRVSKAREQLDATDRFEFDSVLKRAQEATTVREDCKLWIDSRAMYQVRRVLKNSAVVLPRAGCSKGRTISFILPSPSSKR